MHIEWATRTYKYKYFRCIVWLLTWLCISSSAAIKQSHTLRERLPVGQFLNDLDRLITKWSTSRDPNCVNYIPFVLATTITLRYWTSAYQWASLNKTVLQHGAGGADSMTYLHLLARIQLPPLWWTNSWGSMESGRISTNSPSISVLGELVNKIHANTCSGYRFVAVLHVPSFNWTLKLSKEVVRERATYNCPWLKTYSGRYIPTFSSVCPWDLLIVI